MLVMYSFLSRTSRIVNEITSSPILLMSSIHVERMRSATISGSFTICSTVKLSDDAAQMALHHQAYQTLTLIRRFGKELLGSRKNRLLVRAHLDLSNRLRPVTATPCLV